LNRKQIRIRKRENYNQFSNKNPQRKKKKPWVGKRASP
jgi:hypothetical protein